MYRKQVYQFEMITQVRIFIYDNIVIDTILCQRFILSQYTQGTICTIQCNLMQSNTKSTFTKLTMLLVIVGEHCWKFQLYVLLRSYLKVVVYWTTLYWEMFAIISHLRARRGQNIRNSSQYNIVQYNTTSNYNLNVKTYHLINTGVTMSTKLNIVGMIKVDVVAEQLLIDCTAVPNQKAKS